MESVFLLAFGIAIGMAAFPWVQRIAERIRRVLAELELDGHVTPRGAAPDDEPHPF